MRLLCKDFKVRKFIGGNCKTLCLFGTAYLAEIENFFTKSTIDKAKR